MDPLTLRSRATPTAHFKNRRFMNPSSVRSCCLECKPSNDKAIPRHVATSEARRNGVHISEARSRISVGESRLRRLRIRGARITPEATVENIRELKPKIERILFFYTPCPADVHVFCRTPLGAIVSIISCRSAKLASGRIAPCGRIQSERFVWIVAVAVKVHGERRLSRNPVCQRVLE